LSGSCTPIDEVCRLGWLLDKALIDQQIRMAEIHSLGVHGALANPFQHGLRHWLKNADQARGEKGFQVCVRCDSGTRLVHQRPFRQRTMVADFKDTGLVFARVVARDVD
jgi:hypothetical protein